MNSIKPDYVNKTNNEVVKILKSPSPYVFKPEIVRVSSKKRDHHDQKPGDLCRLFSKGNWNINETDKIKEDKIDRKRGRSLFLAHDHSHENGKLSKPSAQHCVSSRINQLDNKRQQNHQKCVSNDNSNGNNRHTKIIGKPRNTNRNKDQENKNSDWNTRNPQDYCLPENHMDIKTENKSLIKDIRRKNSNIDIKSSSKCQCDKLVYHQDSPFPSVNSINKLSSTKEIDKHGYSSKLSDKFDKYSVTVCQSSKCSNIKNEYFRLNGVFTQDEVNNEKGLELFDGKNEGNVLYRSRSLPQLSNHDSGVASGQENPHGRPNSRLVADLRQLLTLKQHYYPEGNYGWVIVIVGVLIQILSHGIHGAVGVLLQNVMIKFDKEIYRESGLS